MFDTHVHLNDETLYLNIDKYIQEAQTNGVSNFLVVSWDLESSIKAIEISNKYECCHAAIGFHPCDARALENNDVLNKFLELFKTSSKIVAIGEIGLDYHWEKDENNKELQRKWFKYQLNLARKLNLPVSIHSREATQDTYDILKEYKDIKIILHCYNESLEITKQYLKQNIYFAIGGVITFKNAKNLIDVVPQIPLDRLLIETDAPYLAPVPYRGKINEPKYIKETLLKISEILNIEFDKLDKFTSLNARKVLFNE